jgi:catechol 2,3-dioxygenase-like lactoylglutathione lyase family enzyme
VTGTSDAPEPLAGLRFERIALALERPTDLWPLMAASLGGQYVGRGHEVGYGWTQLRFANGFVVEGLNPESAPGTDFLRRFLDRHGVGPHHLTFSVADLDLAADRLRAAGVEPAASTGAPTEWREVVVAPGDAMGTVVQLIEQVEPPAPPLHRPEGFPDLDYDHPVASLGRVVHAVADLDVALGFYRDLLGGAVTSTGAAIDGNHWVELGWQGPGRLRLLEARHAEIADWVGDRPGRIRHLFFSHDEPAHVPGARQVSPGRWVVDPDGLLGTRLVLASTAR